MRRVRARAAFERVGFGEARRLSHGRARGCERRRPFGLRFFTCPSTACSALPSRCRRRVFAGVCTLQRPFILFSNPGRQVLLLLPLCAVRGGDAETERERERGEMTLPASPWELGVEPELKPRPSSCRIQVLTVLPCRLSNRALGFQIINNYNDSDKKQTKKTTRSSARKVSVSTRNQMTLQAAEPSSELALM